MEYITRLEYLLPLISILLSVIWLLLWRLNRWFQIALLVLSAPGISIQYFSLSGCMGCRVKDQYHIRQNHSFPRLIRLSSSWMQQYRILQTALALVIMKDNMSL